MSVVGTGLSNAPTEILEKILDFLHGDSAALYAASLVRREWVPRSRYHLFNQTVIKEYSVPYKINTIKANVHSFLALVRSEHCTIIHAIRRLILMILSPELIKDVIDVLVLSKAAPSQIVYIHHARSAPISWNAHAFQNVDDFTFNMEWHAFDDEAWNLIASFPRLRTLSLYTKPNTSVTLPPDILGSSFRHLRTLRLRLVAFEALLYWLTNIDGSHLALETFDLQMIRSCHRSWGPVKALNAFLESVSGTLKHLRLGVDVDMDLYLDGVLLAMGPPIDLSPLIHLSSLFLRTHDLDAICDTLASLNSESALEVLTIHAVGWAADIFNAIKECDCDQTLLFQRFATTINSKPLTGLRTLEMNFDRGLDVGVGVRAMERCNIAPISFTGNWNDYFQPNSLGSIKHLVYGHLPP